MRTRLTPARALDVVGAAAVLAVAAPVLAAAALAIRGTDGAPVLFRQQRLGRGRRPFTIIKLRTMAAGRVTPIGRGAARPRHRRAPATVSTCCAAKWRWWARAR